MLIYAAGTEEGAPDQQISGSLFTPRKGSEEETADNLSAGNNYHGAQHQYDYNFHHLVEYITEFMNYTYDRQCFIPL
jgi:hypothetical protein